MDFEVHMVREFELSVDRALWNETAAVKFRFAEIESVWRVFDAFEFDFTGVSVLTPGFSYALFGRLAETYGEWVRDKVRIQAANVVIQWQVEQTLAAGIRCYEGQPKA